MATKSAIQVIVDEVEALGGTREDVNKILGDDIFVRKVGEMFIEEKRELERTIKFVLPECFSTNGLEGLTISYDYERHHCGRSVSVRLYNEYYSFYFGIKTISDLLKYIASNSLAGARAFDFLYSHENLISVDIRKFTWIFPGTIFKCSCGRASMRGFFFDKVLIKTIVHADERLVKNRYRIAIFHGN